MKVLFLFYWSDKLITISLLFLYKECQNCVRSALPGSMAALVYDIKTYIKKNNHANIRYG